MTTYAPIDNTPDYGLKESISISYVGHGETFTASLQCDGGLKADSTYHWLLRAIRSIGFEALAEQIQSNNSKGEIP